MRLAHRLLMATPASIGSKSSLSEALALLPPLQLYRRILRIHRKLDPEMRVLGDSYVKKEFRAHRTAENPLHIVCLLACLVELRGSWVSGGEGKMEAGWFYELGH